jgi:hypothetical protein
MTFHNWPAISQGQQQGSARGDQREKMEACQSMPSSEVSFVRFEAGQQLRVE